MNALVVGCGSIGKRHLNNLHALDVQSLAACDSDHKQLESASKQLEVQPFTDYEQALAAIQPDVVFICTPPVFHVPQALQAVRTGAHVFIEKPLSSSLDSFDELLDETRRRQRIAQVGYNLRFDPGLQIVKRYVESGAVGRVLWAHVEFGQYLPDWRPQQDYRQSYTARRELGGGIILDASHELDYTLWLLGRPVEVLCMAGRTSELEVEVEDCATILLRFDNGTQADVHLDFVQRGYSRRCKLATEKGNIVWDYATRQIRVFRAETKTWKTESYDCEPNDMYLEEVRHFLNCVAENARPLVDLEQAGASLKVALTAKSSAAKGQAEQISW